jgi:hypothetical protein
MMAARPVAAVTSRTERAVAAWGTRVFMMRQFLER